MLINQPDRRDAELVLGLVSPIGTDVDPVIEVFREALSAVGYSSIAIRLSELLDAIPSDPPLPRPDEPEYYERRMDAGDDLRRRLDSNDALAGLAIAAIRARRALDGDEHDQARRHAWILRSLKHPDEARLMRATYGTRFVLVGVSAPPADRRATLVQRLRDQSTGVGGADVAVQAQTLLSRDEKDQTAPHGQGVRDTFAMSDFFLQVRRGQRPEADVRRVVDLLFGRPFVTPTRDEQAMFHAQAAALRSSDAGRQVGAVITAPRGEVLATGTNEVPAPGGGEYWPNDTEDHRDFQHGRDFNEQMAHRLIAEVLERLRRAGWLAVDRAAAGRDELVDAALGPGGPLRDARVMDLLEFGRIVHAEMSALSQAARMGMAVADGTIFTTTYPCHLCARLIIASGLRRVVYVDPYPKSLVPEMYGDAIDDSWSDSPREHHVAFQPFVGVAPRLFPVVFEAVNRRRDTRGHFVPWAARASRLRVADFDSLAGADALEESVVVSLGERLERLRPIG